MFLQIIIVKIYIELAALRMIASQELTGRSTSCKISQHAHACRPRKKQAPAGPLKNQDPDPVGADRHRRHPQLLVINSGYLQRGVHRPSCYIQCLWQQFVQTSCGQHTYQSVGGREGAGSIGKHIGGRSEKGNGSWLDRDGHGKHRGSRCRVVVGCGL